MKMAPECTSLRWKIKNYVLGYTVRPFVNILRDAISLYVVDGFQWNLARMSIMWVDRNCWESFGVRGQRSRSFETHCTHPVLISFQSQSQLNIWISCFSIFRSTRLKLITCQHPRISITSYFQTSSKDILFSVSLPKKQEIQMLSCDWDWKLMRTRQTGRQVAVA